MRNLCRAREDAVTPRQKSRQQLQAFLLRQGRRYPGKTTWTKSPARCGAQDKGELLASLSTFAGYLEGCMSYFDEVGCLADLASAYSHQEGFGNAPSDQVTHLEQLGVANYGLLLVLTGDVEKGRLWIEASQASMKTEGILKYAESRVAELDALMDRIRAGGL